MSIIIKGMKMPERGKSVFLRIDDRGEVYILKRCTNNYNFYPTTLYKAVELPPHGRIIDADEFELSMQHEWEKNNISNGTWIDIREWLKDAPTIIEEEGEGE